MDGSLSSQIALILIFLILSGFFSFSETALTSLGEIRARKIISEKANNAGFMKFWFSSQERILDTVFFGNTICLTSATVIIWNLKWTFMPDFHTLPALIALILLLFIAAEFLPKTIARKNPDTLIIPCLIIIRPFYHLFYPFTWLMAFFSGKPTNGKYNSFTGEDLAYILDNREEGAALEEGTQQMISGVLEISDTSVKEVMVPRTDMVAVEKGISKEELLSLLAENEHSRVPVYDENLDKIIGILYMKDLIKLMRRESWGVQDYMAMMHEPMFVPESKRVNDMLTAFQRERQQMAVVVDEYGGVAGIVTMEDILEEIVGDIWDEYDDEQEEIVPIGEDEYRVDARTNIDDLCEYFDMERTDDMSDYDTVGGLVYDVAGAIPSEGDRFKWRGFEIIIKSMIDNRLCEIDFVKLKDEQPPVEQSSEQA